MESTIKYVWGVHEGKSDMTQSSPKGWQSKSWNPDRQLCLNQMLFKCSNFCWKSDRWFFSENLWCFTPSSPILTSTIHCHKLWKTRNSCHNSDENHGNLRVPPLCHPPPRNKALKRPKGGGIEGVTLDYHEKSPQVKVWHAARNLTYPLRSRGKKLPLKNFGWDSQSHSSIHVWLPSLKLT